MVAVPFPLPVMCLSLGQSSSTPQAAVMVQTGRSRLSTNVCLCLLEPTWTVGGRPRLKLFGGTNGFLDSHYLLCSWIFQDEENEKVQQRSGLPTSGPWGTLLSRVDGTLSSQVIYTELGSKAKRPSESKESGLLSRVWDAMASENLHTLRLCVYRRVGGVQQDS